LKGKNMPLPKVSAIAKSVAHAFRLVTDVPDPLERLRQSKVRLQSDRVTATQEFERAKRQMTDAARAIAENRPEAAKLADEALAAQTAATKHIADIDGMLEATDREIAALEARKRASDDAVRHDNARTAFAQREALAVQLQAQVDAVAETFAEIETLRQYAVRLLPECKDRLRMMPDGWQADSALRVAIDQRLIVKSNGLLGDPRMLGVLTLGELTRKGVDIPKVVAATQRQFAGDFIEQPKEAA
jgi:hypothetical protein